MQSPARKDFLLNLGSSGLVSVNISYWVAGYITKNGYFGQLVDSLLTVFVSRDAGMLWLVLLPSACARGKRTSQGHTSRREMQARKNSWLPWAPRIAEGTVPRSR